MMGEFNQTEGETEFSLPALTPTHAHTHTLHIPHKRTQEIEYSHTPTGKALIRTTNTAEYFHIQPHTTFTPFLTQWCVLSPTHTQTHIQFETF